MDDTPIDVLALVSQSPVLGALPEDERRALAAAARIERHDVSAPLNLAGTPLAWLRLVVGGHIEVIARHASGNEVALGDIGPGGWATWVACLSPMPPEHDFYAGAHSVFVALPASMVRAACERHPALYPRVIADLGVRMRQLMEWTGESVLLGPEQRMAKLIHLLSRVHGLPAEGGSLPVTQSRLASMARCSRQSANLLVGALERRGLIGVAYGRFEIPSLARLAAFVAAEDPDTF